MWHYRRALSDASTAHETRGRWDQSELSWRNDPARWRLEPRGDRYSYVMRPLRYSINVTLDGCCDHRAIVPDEDLHRHAVANLNGADAVIGIRYDANELMKGVTEVLCYGTAVRVEPVER